MNKYDLLAWWSRVLNSCETEIQFRNALKIWPKVMALTPCVDDAWREVVRAAKVKLNRLVPPLSMEGVRYGAYRIKYPKTTKQVLSSVFGMSQSWGK